MDGQVVEGTHLQGRWGGFPTEYTGWVAGCAREANVSVRVGGPGAAPDGWVHKARPRRGGAGETPKGVFGFCLLTSLEYLLRSAVADIPAPKLRGPTDSVPIHIMIPPPRTSPRAQLRLKQVPSPVGIPDFSAPVFTEYLYVVEPRN